MIILADENIDHRIIEAIRGIGIEVNAIYFTSRGVNDLAVVGLSRTPPKIILTEDKDFGQLIFKDGISGISVIFLRYSYTETEAIIDQVKMVLQNRPDHLSGYFTTITINKIRSRKL